MRRHAESPCLARCVIHSISQSYAQDSTYTYVTTPCSVVSHDIVYLITKKKERENPFLGKLFKTVNQCCDSFSLTRHTNPKYHLPLQLQDAPTMEAAALARRESGMDPAPYMPHLSLLYADLPEEKKQEVSGGPGFGLARHSGRTGWDGSKVRLQNMQNVALFLLFCGA